MTHLRLSGTSTILAALSLALLGLATLPQAACAQTTVLPNAYATASGTFDDNTPVSNRDRTYQMQIGVSQLGALTVGDSITGLTFRLDKSSHNPSNAASFENWELTLAQATNTVAGMSTTFADNMTNSMLVRSGALSFNAGAFTATSTPRAFGPVISFSTPYTYQGGDLVIQIAHSAGSSSVGFMDSLSGAAPGVGTDFGAMVATSFNATTANSQGHVLITQLSFVSGSAPEPGTLALLALGMVGGALARRRK